MTQDPLQCQICCLSQKTDRKIALLIKKVIRSFQNNAWKVFFMKENNDKKQKQDQFLKLITYLLKEIDQNATQEKSFKCKNHKKLKIFISENLNLDKCQFDALSQSIFLKVLKGKYELNTMGLLAKNLAKKKSFYRQRIKMNQLVKQKSGNTTTGSEQNNEKISDKKNQISVEIMEVEPIPEKEPIRCGIKEINPKKQTRNIEVSNQFNLCSLQSPIMIQNVGTQATFPPFFYYGFQ